MKVVAEISSTCMYNPGVGGIEEGVAFYLLFCKKSYTSLPVLSHRWFDIHLCRRDITPLNVSLQYVSEWLHGISYLVSYTI